MRWKTIPSHKLNKNGFMKNFLVIILGFIIFSCTRNSSTEKYQTDRNNVENVHDCIKEFETDSILIGNNARIYNG